MEALETRMKHAKIDSAHVGKLLGIPAERILDIKHCIDVPTPEEHGVIQRWLDSF